VISTLVIPVAPALLQVSGAVPGTPLELVLNATTTTQVVLILLACLSLLSWAIMLAVGWQVSRAGGAAERFGREFERASRLEEANAVARRAKPGALPRLFLHAMRFVADARVVNQQAHERANLERDTPVNATLSGSQIETLHLLLDTDASGERDRLGRFLPWLATIGSVSPLIGLLGTVLGVIEAFLGIATKGSGNLAAVAPGVGEALIATAAALAVAIPATFGYNILAARVNRFDGRMEAFGTAVIALLAREGKI
jgi:biopolymer transport protein TolQ